MLEHVVVAKMLDEKGHYGDRTARLRSPDLFFARYLSCKHSLFTRHQAVRQDSPRFPVCSTVLLRRRRGRLPHRYPSSCCRSMPLPFRPRPLQYVCGGARDRPTGLLHPPWRSALTILQPKTDRVSERRSLSVLTSHVVSQARPGHASAASPTTRHSRTSRARIPSSLGPETPRITTRLGYPPALFVSNCRHSCGGGGDGGRGSGRTQRF